MYNLKHTVFLVVSLLIIALWLIGPLIASHLQEHWDSYLDVTSHPNIGDTYSMIGALFSGLAFTAVILTLYQQQEQINKQQEQTNQTQGREHVFQLMNALQTAVNSVRYNQKQGHEALVFAENQFLGQYNGDNREFLKYGVLREMRGAEPIADKKVVRKAFQKFYEKEIGGCLPHVFRIQVQVLKVIDSSALSESMRKELADVFRSMLSDPELHLLLYFSLSSYADEECQKLLCKYDILDNLLYKQKQFICDRIPEIAHLEKYSNWQSLRDHLI